MICTSPAYFNLRSYQGIARWEGGDPECDHQVGRFEYKVSAKQKSNAGSAGHLAKNICPKCGAKRVDAQFGIEEQPDCLGWATGVYCGQCYICKLVAWGKELWRVLRPEGTFWLNLGDSYNGSGGAGGDYGAGGLREGQPKFKGARADGLKPKDIIGIPWRAAFALQANGWYLRNDIPWFKRNVMPSSASDRFSVSHEYVFVLSKSQRYYFDMEAIRVPYTKPMNRRGGEKLVANGESAWDAGTGQTSYRDRDMRPHPQGRQYRTNDYFYESLRAILQEEGGKQMLLTDPEDNPMAFTFNTSTYKGAHFATWSPKLVEPMIRAGSSEAGCCPTCGAPWERVVERTPGVSKKTPKTDALFNAQGGVGEKKTGTMGMSGSGRINGTTETLNWQPSCTCPVQPPKPCLVLDPFSGSGTTIMVAKELGRNGVGLDLSFSYLDQQAKKRVQVQEKLF